MTKARTKAKKAPARASKKRPASLGSNPLPPPLPVDTVTQPEPLPQNSEHKSGGLLGFFEASNPNPDPDPQSLPDGSNGSSVSSYDVVDPEAARLLDAVPDVIGEPVNESGAAPAGDVGGTSAPGAIALPVDSFIDGETLGGLMQFGLSAFGAWRKRTCYELSDEKALRLGTVWSSHVNGYLERWLPAFMTQWAMANPGLAVALATTLGIVGPMAREDWKQTAQERARARVAVHPGTSHVAAAAPAAGTWFHEAGEVAA